MTAIAYLTDVEGDWDKVTTFCTDNPLVRLEVGLDGDRIVVAKDALFVFGGDAIDRGPWSRRIVRTLLRAVREFPDQVVLLAGNRDINKLRLPRELSGKPPTRAPADARSWPRPVLLRWIFDNTMGARQAFEHRRSELAHGGLPSSDDDVVESFLADLGPGGDLRDYVARCRLGFRHGPTLFVHGGVTAHSLHAVPGRPRARDVDAWIAALDDWYREQMAIWLADPTPPGDDPPPWWPLIAYQAPLPGTRSNPESVVYGRTADELNNPLLPERAAIELLADSGIARVVVGHTPMGDTPALLRDGGFELLFADNAHARVKGASRVTITPEAIDVRARTQLDDGSQHDSHYLVQRDERDSPIGRRIEGERYLVKGPLPGGRHELFRYHASYRYEQVAIAGAELAAKPLVAPVS